MVLQRSRIFLALIAGVTFVATISSVRVLSDLLAAHQTASDVGEGAPSGQRGRFIGQAEADIGRHLPNILHRGAKLPSTGAYSPFTVYTDLKRIPPYFQECPTHQPLGTILQEVAA